MDSMCQRHDGFTQLGVLFQAPGGFMIEVSG
jgi:hypothetical protein